MAEYVRRRRPPASHPYWARLHDRAHPPQLVLPIAIPTGAGLLVGLYAGLQPEFHGKEAVKVSAQVAIAFAAAVFGVAVLILWIDGVRQTPRPSLWTAALFGGLGVAAAAFLILFGVLTILLLLYSACSGRGALGGMFIGGATCGLPAALIAVGNRRRWQERQRQWPRWERMRSPRRPNLSVTPVAAPPLPSTDPAPLSPARERPIG